LNINSVNSGDGIDYHQRFGENIGDLIQVTPLESHHLKGDSVARFATSDFSQ